MHGLLELSMHAHAFKYAWRALYIAWVVRPLRSVRVAVAIND
jgi:hypothetical protein